MSHLEQWWAEQRMPPEVDQDETVPAYPWMPDGTRIEYPVSFVAAVYKKWPVLINLDQLRRSTLAALAGKPDTRNAQQMSIDAWAAYQAAKAKYGTQEEANGGRPAEVQEARQEAEGAPAAAEARPQRTDDQAAE